VGCGGGLASMPLARLGFDVTGIDAGAENIDIATNYAMERKIDAIFLNETAEAHAERETKYDVIICLEMIEHVNNVEILIDALAKLVKKNGIIIISTINRTLKAKFLAIEIAEYILNLLPRNTHNFNKFQKPSEIANYFAEHNIGIQEIKGLVFDIFARKWKLSDNIDINYICLLSEQRI
jgi:2-polyprenyl-6-hydroxyphenyl methylase/3-demethylubiquinone-9 3-methyltransferase